jgi:ribosomal protein S3
MIGWQLMDKIQGFSIEWSWFGLTGNLSKELAKEFKRAEVELTEIDLVEAEVAAAKQRLAVALERRKKFKRRC